MGGIETETLKGWSEGRRCDYCKTASAAAFCRAHLAFLCLNCDSKLHHGADKVNPMSQRPHERFWMCEVCEQAPAAVTCKADAAALCITCDDDIHSANPLARRHERVPIEPFVDPTQSYSSPAFNLLVPTEAANLEGKSSWMFSDPGLGLGLPIPIPIPIPIPHPDINSGNFQFNEAKTGEMSGFFPEMDSGALLEFDSVVPVRIKPSPSPSPSPSMFSRENNCFDIDFDRSKLSTTFNFVPSQSISHSVSSSSVDVGVVPDGNNSMSEISFPFVNMTSSSSSLSDVVSNGATFSSSSTTTTTTTTWTNNNTPGLDREARVLRYREKRKNRKFEKTIRYASRKAYAETRPRIKGRFAKRTDTEPEEDEEAQDTRHLVYSSSASVCFVGAEDTQYGLVPTF